MSDFSTQLMQSIDRRLEVLAREIAEGPKLKPGFFMEDGKLGYAHPTTNFSLSGPVTGRTSSATTRQDEGKEDPFTCFLKIGDRVRARPHNEPHFDGVVESRGRNAWIRVRGTLGACNYRREELEFLGRGEVKESPPTFDPMTEPLEVGDLVEILYHDLRGKRGRVTRDAKLGGSFVVNGVENKHAHWSFGYRSSLKLLEKAEKIAPVATPRFDPMAEPLQVGDLVEVAIEGHGDIKGRQGRVVRMDAGYIYVLPEKSGQTMCFAMRSSLKLIEKAKKIPK